MKYFDVEKQLHFFEACYKGDRLEVEKLLRSDDIDVTFQHELNKWTALHWAAKGGHEIICDILLRAGFSPYCVDNQGKTPADTSKFDKIKALLNPELKNSREMHEVEQPHEVNDNKFTPGYIKYPNFPYTKQSSLDGSNPSSPTIRGYYSYGRRDSATRTRFLLVRTSCAAGKEAFKRITLPGGSTVEELKKTIENAMKSGHVKAMMTLPDKVLIEEDCQIEGFDNCQKIDVIFGESVSILTNTVQNNLKNVKLPQSASPSENPYKVNNNIVTPPSTPVQEGEPPFVPEARFISPKQPVEAMADLYFKKEQHLSAVEKNVPLPNVERDEQNIHVEPKSWTTAQKVAVVATAAGIVGIGCYIYKLRK